MAKEWRVINWQYENKDGSKQDYYDLAFVDMETGERDSAEYEDVEETYEAFKQQYLNQRAAFDKPIIVERRSLVELPTGEK